MGITDETVEEIANESSASTTSVLRRLLRLPVKAKTAARIDRVLIARGFLREDATTKTERRAS
ncbi:MAG TPA: hypothetical protein VH054_29505 [Polyangiaceae bacterium]|jgi:SOS response regulatory protein OraA/RecX|nr:hypothetical protein [Polyangiaceae bacterium]